MRHAYFVHSVVYDDVSRWFKVTGRALVGPGENRFIGRQLSMADALVLAERFHDWGALVKVAMDRPYWQTAIGDIDGIEDGTLPWEDLFPGDLERF